MTEDEKVKNAYIEGVKMGLKMKANADVFILDEMANRYLEFSKIPYEYPYPALENFPVKVFDINNSVGWDEFKRFTEYRYGTDYTDRWGESVKPPLDYTIFIQLATAQALGLTRNPTDYIFIKNSDEC